jgi:hypothetical protein
MTSRASLLLLALVASIAFASAGTASAPPVGPLPAGPTRTISVKAAHTFRVTLAKSHVAGRVWRVARPYDGRVVRETREGETKTTVWIVYRALRPGATRIVYGLTLGEGRHAYAAARFAVRVTK